MYVLSTNPILDGARSREPGLVIIRSVDINLTFGTFYSFGKFNQIRYNQNEIVIQYIHFFK